MAEIYAQVLEHAGYTVDPQLRPRLAPGRASRRSTQGQVDLVPEYVGSGLGYYDKTKVTGDGEANRTALQAHLRPQDATWRPCSAISPGQDTNAAVVRKDTADLAQA